MSKKANKKNSKEKPILKINLWINNLIVKNATNWDIDLANKFLREVDQTKAWKGDFIISKTDIRIKNKSKSFVQTYECSKIKQVMASSFNANMLIIGIFEVDMLYLILRCENTNERDKVINGIKDISQNAMETSVSEPIHENTILNNELRTSFTDESENNNIYEKQIHPRVEDKVSSNIILPKSYTLERQIPDIPTQYRNSPELSMSIQPETSHRQILQIPHTPETNKWVENVPILQKSKMAIPAFREPDNDSLMSTDEDVVWVEYTKYIDYVPSLGRNAETDDGSIYMYCAHQIVPMTNANYDDYSDSD